MAKNCILVNFVVNNSTKIVNLEDMSAKNIEINTKLYLRLKKL